MTKKQLKPHLRMCVTCLELQKGIEDSECHICGGNTINGKIKKII